MLFILGNFLPFYPPNNPKNEPPEKTEKGLEISSFYISVPKIMIKCYTVPMVCDQCNCFFFVFFFNVFFILGHFLPFSPLTAWKMKISIKWKKHLVMSSFHTSLAKTMIVCYTVPEIWRMTHVIVIFHFALFFALLPP